jgi:hypothetical protein
MAVESPDGACSFSFNGIPLTVSKNDAPEVAVDEYLHEMHLLSEAYRASPEGQKAEADRIERVRQAQETMNQAMIDLLFLDFNDLDAVLTWLCRIQDASDTKGVAKSTETILYAFQQHGYAPNETNGSQCDPANCRSMGRHMVGEALAMLRDIGAIHHMLHDFVEAWRAKFAYLEE